MNHPFRLSENESIIIDTRISALEEGMSNARTWKVFAFILIGVLMLDVAVSIASYRVSENKATCHDELKVTSPEHWKLNGSAVTSVGVACTHSRQRGTIVSSTGEALTYACTCR